MSLATPSTRYGFPPQMMAHPDMAHRQEAMIWRHPQEVVVFTMGDSPCSPSWVQPGALNPTARLIWSFAGCEQPKASGTLEPQPSDPGLWLSQRSVLNHSGPLISLIDDYFTVV